MELKTAICFDVCLALGALMSLALSVACFVTIPQRNLDSVYVKAIAPADDPKFLWASGGILLVAVVLFCFQISLEVLEMKSDFEDDNQSTQNGLSTEMDQILTEAEEDSKLQKSEKRIEPQKEVGDEESNQVGNSVGQPMTVQVQESIEWYFSQQLNSSSGNIV